MSKKSREVFFISDRTGITAETLGHSLLSQFENIDFKIRSITFVDDAVKARQAITAINKSFDRHQIKPLVFSTLIDDAIKTEVKKSQGFFLDLFDTFIKPLELELGEESSHALGKTHGMGSYSDYKLRIDAINYTLKNDDGAIVKEYPEADIILLGVSRSGKTPTCLYLALHYGMQAANYPLVEDDLKNPYLPDFLKPFKDKCFGLTIEPMRLSQIRFERRAHGKYAELDQCKLEVRQAEKMFEIEKIPYLNTSTVSIEEISATIMQHTGIKRKLLT